MNAKKDANTTHWEPATPSCLIAIAKAAFSEAAPDNKGFIAREYTNGRRTNTWFRRFVIGAVATAAGCASVTHEVYELEYRYCYGWHGCSSTIANSNGSVTFVASKIGKPVGCLKMLAGERLRLRRLASNYLRDFGSEGFSTNVGIEDIDSTVIWLNQENATEPGIRSRIVIEGESSPLPKSVQELAAFLDKLHTRAGEKCASD